MSDSYCCPNCGTNRTWFHKIKQQPTSVKMDPASGDVLEEYVDDGELPPFITPYHGPQFRIQCGVCGLIGEEIMFIQTARNTAKARL